MNVSRGNTVALNVLSDTQLRELIDDMEAERRSLREDYRLKLAALAVTRSALDDCTRTLMFARENNAYRKARS